MTAHSILPDWTAPVIVTYDARGVPNIAASNLPDLFFAQGYVTAQDRLWQMDMVRRYASGDLAVILGPDYVSYDREHRILGLRQVAEKSAANMDQAQRAQFESYAAGVNAYIEQHRKTLPMEFRFLGYFPHVWTVEDSLLVGLSMTEFLNHGFYRDELEKEKILAKLGPELTADLFVNMSWRDHPPGADNNSIENEIPSETTPDEEDEQAPANPKATPAPHGKSRSELRPLNNAPHSGLTAGDHAFLAALVQGSQGLREERYRAGSNNWAVSGAHTVSGKPLLSNDMHLLLGDSQCLVRGASDRWGLRRCGRHPPWHAVRDCGTQQTHRVGIH